METAPFSPFLLATEVDLVGDVTRPLSLERLEGAGELRWLARFRTWGEALAARDHCRERSGLPPNAPEAPYRFLPDPVHQYLLTTG
ncbi:MAG TPA: DNA polymerase II, partial [Methylomirabilota bacterium]